MNTYYCLFHIKLEKNYVNTNTKFSVPFAKEPDSNSYVRLKLIYSCPGTVNNTTQF